MYQEVIEVHDYSANVIFSTPGNGHVAGNWKDDQTLINRQRQEIGALKQMLKAACELAGIDNPLVLCNKSVKALNLGPVPSVTKQQPSPLSVKLKSG